MFSRFHLPFKRRPAPKTQTIGGELAPPDLQQNVPQPSSHGAKPTKINSGGSAKGFGQPPQRRQSLGSPIASAVTGDRTAMGDAPTARRASMFGPASRIPSRESSGQEASSGVPGFAQLTEELPALYQSLDLLLSERTSPSITDEDVIGIPQLRSRGVFNKVYEVTLNRPGSPAQLFKPLSKTLDPPFLPRAMGMDPQNGHVANRNLATVACDRLLDFGVIVPTRIAALTMPPPTTDEWNARFADLDELWEAGPKPTKPMLTLGLLMDRAEGTPAANAKRDLLRHPDVVREVTKLQLMDHLVGQVDRHSQNYFVNVDDRGRAKVTGIDNDFCFGTTTPGPEDIRPTTGHAERHEFKGTRLPPVVDEDMARAILGLDEDALRQSLEECGLGRAELEAAVGRLRAVKEHCKDLQAQGSVIRADRWGDVLELLNPQNSYAKRDFPEMR